MSLDAEVEAGFDLGPFSLKALAEIGATLNGMHKQLKKLAAYEEAYQFGATSVALRGTTTTDSAGDSAEIGLGGPTYGRLWQIRTLAVGGSLWTTTVAGTALVVIGPSRTVTPALTDIVDESTSLPNVTQYGSGQLVVRHPNHLRIVLLSPTAATVYAAGGWATDLPDHRQPISVTD